MKTEVKTNVKTGAIVNAKNVDSINPKNFSYEGMKFLPKLGYMALKDYIKQSSKYDLEPFYQREEAWGVANEMALFENLKMGKAPQELTVRIKGNIKEMTDGKQRTITLWKIVNDRVKDKNGKVFSELSKKIQRKILSTIVIQIQYIIGDDESVRNYFLNINNCPRVSKVDKICAMNKCYIVIARKLRQHPFMKLMDLSIKKRDDIQWLTQLLSIIWQRKNNMVGVGKIGLAYGFPGLIMDIDAQEDLIKSTGELLSFMLSITENVDKSKTNNKIGKKPDMLEIAYMLMLYMEKYGNKKNGMSLRHINLEYSIKRNRAIEKNTDGFTKASTGRLLDGKVMKMRLDFAEVFLVTKVAKMYNLTKFKSEI